MTRSVSGRDRSARMATAKLVLANTAAIAAAATLFAPSWIEYVFGFDPDSGSGALEWLFVVSLAVASVALGWSGFADRRRDHAEFV